MQILVVIAIVVLMGTSFISRSRQEKPETKILGESVSIAPTPTVIPTPSLVPTQTNTPTPSSVPIIPTNTPKPASPLIYPGAKVVSSTSYESTDEVNQITEWYKAQIRSQGYTTKSFVTTNTNGEILNKLAAAKSNGSILVEIAKSSASNSVRIHLELDK